MFSVGCKLSFNFNMRKAMLLGSKLFLIIWIKYKKIINFLHSMWKTFVAPGFKNKTRYTTYVSPESQISHIAINKGNINRQCLIYNILSIKDITLDNKQWKRQLHSSGEDSNSTETTDWLITSLIPPNSSNLVPIRDFFPNM